jgi:hypothetical protein
LTSDLCAARYESKLLPETKYLICQSPEGPKYNAALKWGLPVVGQQWLVDCANEGRIVDHHPYSFNSTSNTTTAAAAATVPDEINQLSSNLKQPPASPQHHYAVESEQQAIDNSPDFPLHGVSVMINSSLKV